MVLPTRTSSPAEWKIPNQNFQTKKLHENICSLITKRLVRVEEVFQVKKKITCLNALIKEKIINIRGL